MVMPGRNYSAGSEYRYGFNGQEKSAEIFEGSTTAEYWEYDSRTGRRWNADPSVKAYESSYLTFAGNPIWFMDRNGLDTVKPKAHVEVDKIQQKYNLKGDNPKWTNTDIINWKIPENFGGGKKYLFKRKSEFVQYYRSVIKDAAAAYGIPEILLAGVAFTEFGGKPTWSKKIVRGIREFDWSGNDETDKDAWTNNPDRTSFGDMAVQLRRAGEELGYKSLDKDDRDALQNSLTTPITGIYIAAMHLRTLKNVDFLSTAAQDLTETQIKIIATRYNRGPELSMKKILENTSYGNSIYKHKTEITNALNGY